MDNVEHCINKLLLGAKHGDSGQCRLAGLLSGGADGWYCGKGTLILVSDFLAEFLRDYYTILWKFHKNQLDSRS
jgi:hypothetical protein